ncbi:MAG TPA: recombinase family protein [Terriglobia bacterium]|nr:recombinase family protein [Terriglobia bacterium]
MNAAIYARISTIEQETENQLAEMRRFVASQSWQLASEHEYIDRGESGKHSNRPEFQRLFSDAARHRFDVVVFWSLDRFSREGTLPTLQHLERLTGYGVAFRSITELYLDSCGVFKDAVISILATIAKQERIRMAERTRAGIARARAGGKRIGRPPKRVTPKQVRELMEGKQISRRQAAKELGISPAWITRHLQNPVEKVSGVVSKQESRS